MTNKILGAALATLCLAGAAEAHTNTVGFILSDSATSTCVAGTGSSCYDVEVFYGTWHAGGVPAEGDLAIFLQNGDGSETQVIGQSATGGTQIPFTLSHSQTGTIPNSGGGVNYDYSATGTADYTALQSAFTLGSNYFFAVNNGASLGAAPDGSTSSVYAHQSAVGVGLGAGTYRIDYDPATSGSLTANWQRQAAVGTATFTIVDGGGVIVDTGGAPTVTLTAPGASLTSPFTVNVTFSEDVTGLAIGDFVVTNGAATNLVSNSGSSYSFTVTPSAAAQTGGLTVNLPEASAQDGDNNDSNASNTLNVTASAPGGGGTPTGLTEEQVEEIRTVVRTEAVAALRGQVANNRAMTRDARERLVAIQNCAQLDDLDPTSPEFDQCDDLVTRNVPLDVDGFAAMSGGVFSTSGSFFGQTGDYTGTKRRIVFGNFDISHSSDTGTRVSIDGRVAWERQMTDDLLLGSFIAGQLSQSGVGAGYTGTSDYAGVSGGGYFVRRLSGDLMLEGYGALGYGYNYLDMTDGVLDVISAYESLSANAGLTLSGEREFSAFTLVPELSVDYGYAHIGNVNFDATAAGFSTSTALDAGYVSMASVELAPGFVFPIAVDAAGFDTGSFTLRPSVSCEMVQAGVTTTDCGGGVSFELRADSADQLQSANARLGLSQVGDETRSFLSLGFESRF